MPSDYGGRPQSPFDLNDIQWDQVSRWIRIASVVAAVFLLLFLVKSMFYSIEASDEGVVLQFGKLKAKVQPGLHWKWPWPIETVYKVPVQRIQTLEFGYKSNQPGRKTQFAPTSEKDLGVAEMLTGDLNLGLVEWIVQYRVKDSMQYMFKVGGTEGIGSDVLPSGVVSDPNPAVPDTIRDVSESVMRKLVGDSSIDYVLTIGRDKIAKDAEEMIQRELDSFEMGINVITVKLQTTSPPTEEVQEAFQKVNRARQQKEQVINEARGKRNSIIPAARGARDRAITEAEGYQNRIVLQTTGKINAFRAQLIEFEKAPEVTRMRLYLEAMEKILAAVGSKTIIDVSVRGVLPLLNLDQNTKPNAAAKGTVR